MTRTEIFSAKEITSGLCLASCLRQHTQNDVRWSDIQECCEDRVACDFSLSTTFTRPLSARYEIRASGEDIGKNSVVQEE